MYFKYLFLIIFFLPFFASADVVINEVAWMGTDVHYTDEWIELYSSSAVDLTGWVLSIVDKKDIPSFFLS